MRDARRTAALTASTALAGVLLALPHAGPAGAVSTPGAARAVTPTPVFSPTVAYNPRSDEYLVAYMREPSDREREPAVTLARRLDRSGAPIGPEAGIAETPAGSGPSGHVLAYNTRRDEYLLVWRASLGGYGTPYELYGQRIGPTGKPIGKRRTLLGASDQRKRQVQCCDELHVVHHPRRDGYLLTWRDQTGVLGSNAVRGRRVAADLGTGPVRRLTGDLHYIAHDVAWSGDGFVVAGWSWRPSGAAQALRTRYVDATGRGRGAETAIATRHRGVVLARNDRNGRLAVAWSTHTGGLRVRSLDRLGRPLGTAAVIDPRGQYLKTTPNWLSYNRRADRYLLGWTGWRDDPEHEDEVLYDHAVRTLAGDASRPLGGAAGVAGHLGGVAASARESRWVGLFGGGRLWARPFGP